MEGRRVQGWSGLQHEVQDETLTENANLKEGWGTAVCLPSVCKSCFHSLAVGWERPKTCPGVGIDRVAPLVMVPFLSAALCLLT